MRTRFTDWAFATRARGNCAFLILLLAFAGPIAQAAIVYGQAEGLANLSVQAVALDDQGYLWAGTEDGALRFDGHRFLRLDLDAPGALPDAHARRMLAVPGALYIATPSRLLRYDLNLHSLRVVRSGAEDIAELNALDRSSDGSIYAGGESGVLWHWRDGDSADPKPIDLGARSPLGGINGITVGPSGVWLATNTGVHRFDPATRGIEALPVAEPSLNNGAVFAISTIEFPAGVLWIGYWNDALIRLDLKTKAHRWFHPAQAGAGAMRSTSIYGFAQRDDRLYVATNRGIVVYHPSCDCMRGLNIPDWDRTDGAGIVITQLVTEHDGLWAGIWGGGLVRFAATDEVFQNQVRRDNRADSLAHPMVYALHVSNDADAANQRLWIGSYGGGVQYSAIAQQRDGEMWSLQAIPMGAYRMESRFIWSLEDGLDALIIGTGRGLFQWRDGALGEIEMNPVLESIRSSLLTGDGRHYIASMRGLYRERSGKLAQVVLIDKTSGRRLPQAIWSLSEQDGELWLGTSNGLLRLDGDEQLLAWHEAGQREDQLPGPVVRVQKRDLAGDLWLATSGGLVRVLRNAEQVKFERHPALAAIGVKNITNIEFDRAGQIWLGSPNGLLRYLPESNTVELYDSKDGLISDQLNANASANDGRLLYFGGMGGFTAFDPAQMPARTVALSPRIARLRLGQGAWQLDAKKLQLAHQHEPIQAELTALSYARPMQVRYAYRWRETERTFTELGDAQSLVFSRLPSGLNTLELRASVGAQRSMADVLTIEIAPAWYETWWGRGWMALLVVLLLIAWTRWRTLRARGYAKQLEGDVADRTAQLTAATAALVAANARLQQQATLDPLTGLANRRQLFEVAAQKLQSAASIGLMLCDLDNFKRVNDEFGHQAGDAVLRHFSELLQQLVGTHGLASRYGGEEFIGLIFDVSEDELTSLARQLVDSVRAARVNYPGRIGIRYTSSVGLAVGVAGESLDAMIRRADRALYLAKSEGRDRWVLDDGKETSRSLPGYVQQTRERKN